MSPGPDLEAAWTAFYERDSRKIREFVSICERLTTTSPIASRRSGPSCWCGLPTYRLGALRGEFDSWLYHIVRGKTGDLHRSQSRRLLQDDSGKLRTAIDSHPNPGQRLGKTDMFAFAWDELRKKVSERNLKILQMRLVEERSVEEVAEKLQISREQVWYRYQRTRREIKEMGPVLRRPRGSLWGDNPARMHAAWERSMIRLRSPASVAENPKKSYTPIDSKNRGLTNRRWIMIRTSFLAFFVLAVAAVLSSLTNLAADEPKVPAKNENPFAGEGCFLA